MSGLDQPKILILGGTAEAAALAAAIVARGPDAPRVITSLAGRTRAPADVAGEIRIGGFGGVDRMVAYLRDEKITAVIDASHPFAARISGNADAACQNAGVPRLLLDRPPWEPRDGDQWHIVKSTADAAEAVPRFGQRAFLTVGRTELAPFAACSGIWFLVRLVDMPTTLLPLADCEVVAARGPFTLADEQALMQRHEIDMVVCKASGGEMTRAKLDAARMMGCPVVMISRPAVPEGPRVDSVAAAQDWLGDVLT